LLRIERYLFLPDAPAHFGLRCPSLMTLQRDEDVEGGALATTLRVLKQVHTRYFEVCPCSPHVMKLCDGVSQNCDLISIMLEMFNGVGMMLY
jgi:hypothetical protein